IAVSGIASAGSVSGQFVVHDRRAAGPEAQGFDPGTNRAYIRLEPALLTISCERIKQILGRELADTSPWRGKISLVLHTANTGDDTITIVSEQFKDGWQYRMDVPDVVERGRFVRVMTQALLLEMSNRNAGAHAAGKIQSALCLPGSISRLFSAAAGRREMVDAGFGSIYRTRSLHVLPVARKPGTPG